MPLEIWLTITTVSFIGLVVWVLGKVPPPEGSVQPMSIPEPADQDSRSAGTNDSDAASKGGWQIAGWLFGAIGALGFVIGIAMKITVQAGPEGIAPGAAEVVNLDLMFQKGVVLAASFAAIFVSTACFAVSAILSGLAKRD